MTVTGAIDGGTSAVPSRSDARPTILQVRSSGGLFGADRIVLDLCRGLGGRAFRVMLVPLVEADGSGQELAGAALKLGIPVEPLRLRWPYDPTAPLRLRRLARRTGAALVHAHDYKADMITALAGGDWSRISTLHGWVGTSWPLRLKERLDARLVRGFDRVICVSLALARAERTRGLQNTHVIPNGIDLAPFAGAPEADVAALKQEFGLEPKAQVIGAIGRLSEEKGYDLLLYAAARLIRDGINLQIFLVGEGPQAGRLRQLARELQISERLVMPGLRPDAARLYPIFDVFCMPSRREGLPLALLEALAAGRAVITTAVGGIPEVVGAGRVAMVIPSQDPEALAAGVRQLLGDADLRRRLGQAGRTRVEQAFSIERMTASVASLYDEILTGATDGRRSRQQEQPS